MYVQDVENVFSLDFNGAGVTYADVFLRAEREYSAYNFEYADTALLMRHFQDAEAECAALLRRDLALPAYDQCIKASHLFNLLDSTRGDQRHGAGKLYWPGAVTSEGVLRGLGSGRKPVTLERSDTISFCRTACVPRTARQQYVMLSNRT